jgi:hypothetical protein
LSVINNASKGILFATLALGERLTVSLCGVVNTMSGYPAT